MRRRKILSLILMAGIVFGLCLSCREPGVMAETSDFDAQIKKAEKAKREAQERVDELKKDIDSLEKDKGDILNYVKKVDEKIEKISMTMKKLDGQIEDAGKELARLEEQLEIAENLEKQQYETMKKRIKYMYESGGDDYVAMIFSAESLGEFLNRSEYIEKISEYDKDLFSKYVETKNSTEIRRGVMESKVEEIAELKDQAATEKDALKSLRSSKKTEIEKLNSAITATDAKAKTFREKVAKAEREVENLLLEKQKEIEKREAARKAAEAKKNGTGTDGTAADPAADTYPVNHGGLRWPLRVPGRISSEFGSRTSPTEGASTNHQGIDIAVSAGTPIVAAGDGTVVTAAYSASAGNYIMLYHGNSLYTVYMHASKLAVSEGAQVKQGDVIAYVGSTGISTGAHLHFGVSVNGAYVNPRNYVSQ